MKCADVSLLGGAFLLAAGLSLVSAGPARAQVVSGVLYVNNSHMT